MPRQRAARLGHLHEAEHTLIHAGAARSGNDDDRALLFRAVLDDAGDFFADDRAHRRSDEIEIHHGDARVASVDLAFTGDDGVLEPGLFPVGLKALLVSRDPAELEGVDRKHPSIMLFESSRIGEALDALPCAQREMVFALRAHLEVLLELDLGHHLPAARAFGPKALRNIALAARTELQRRLLENTHGPFYPRATVMTTTAAAPASFRTRAQASAVEPVVRTSSTKARFRPDGSTPRRRAKAPAKFSKRSSRWK